MLGCQKIKTPIAKGEVTPPPRIMSAPSTLEPDELVISATIYPKEKGTITGIDGFSIPENVSVDIIKGEYVLARTNYKNLGSSGELKLIIDDKKISLEKFVFDENNSIETIKILKSLGMRAPGPVLSNSITMSLADAMRSSRTPLNINNEGLRVLLKNDLIITPSPNDPVGRINSGSIALPGIPKNISILEDDWVLINIEYLYNGKSYLTFTSDVSWQLDKILITFEDGNFILTDLTLDDGVGKG
ncbi:MAG: hypothetical protein WC422_04875 [Candidatus Paceibacterota bacterium]|jgi:hypothetical protein